MKNLEIPKAVLDLLDYDMMPEGMHEQMEKEYVEMKTGVGSWAGDSVIVRRVQNQLKDLGMAVLAAAAGYAVIDAAPEQLNAAAQEALERYNTMFTVIAGKDSMKQAMEKAKELQTKDNARKVVIVVYPEAENADVLYTNVAE